MGSFTQYQDGTGTTFFDTTTIEYGYDFQTYTVPNIGVAYVRRTTATTLTYPWPLCDTVEGILDNNESNTNTFPLTYVWVDEDYTDSSAVTTYPYTSGSLAASVSGGGSNSYPYTATPSAYGSFTIVPAGHTGKVEGLSSATSATLGISKASYSWTDSGTQFVVTEYDSRPTTASASASGWFTVSLANVYSGGGQSFLYSTYAPMFALQNSSGGYDFFNGFTLSNMEASTSSTDRYEYTNTIGSTESTTTRSDFITTYSYSLAASENRPADTNYAISNSSTETTTTKGVSTSYIVPSFVSAGIQQYQQNLSPHPLSDQRSGELDTRMLLWGSPRENVFNTTFLETPKLSAGISLLYPQATPTSFGIEAFYFSQEFGFYRLSSNSVTMYGQTTTAGTGTATETYLTQTSVSQEISINSCSYSSLGAFSSGVSGISTGTWEMSYSGLLGVTSYTTGVSSGSSSSSYFAGISSTAIPFTNKEYRPFNILYVPTTITNSTFKTTTMTLGVSNSNAYVVWGTQGLVAELNGLQGAF